MTRAVKDLVLFVKIDDTPHMRAMCIKNGNLICNFIDKVLLFGDFGDTIADIFEGYQGFSVGFFIKIGEFIERARERSCHNKWQEL